MARRHRKPISPLAWLLGVIFSVASSYAVYRVSASAIKNISAGHAERSQAAIQKLQQQQQARQQLAAPQPVPRPEERAPQHERAVAARLRQAELAKKDDAWDRFYQPPRACMYPESDMRKQVCDSSASKAREKFEAAWAAKQLQTQR